MCCNTEKKVGKLDLPVRKVPQLDANAPHHTETLPVPPLTCHLNPGCCPVVPSVHSPADKLGCELAEDACGAVGPPGLGVAVRQRRGRRPAGVGGALLVPGAPLLACVECAADAHPSGEVGTVRCGGAVDVVGRWGGAGRPLSWSTKEGVGVVGGGGQQKEGKRRQKG